MSDTTPCAECADLLSWDKDTPHRCHLHGGRASGWDRAYRNEKGERTNLVCGWGSLESDGPRIGDSFVWLRGRDGAPTIRYLVGCVLDRVEHNVFEVGYEVPPTKHPFPFPQTEGVERRRTFVSYNRGWHSV